MPVTKSIKNLPTPKGHFLLGHLKEFNVSNKMVRYYKKEHNL